MGLIDGNWLNQYVAPTLLSEYKNYKDDFIGKLKPAPKSAITADGIRMNKLINNVQFKVNNQDEFTPQKMNGKKGIVEWDKFDTTPTEVDTEEIRYLAFDKTSVVREKQNEAFKLGLRDYTLNQLAPEEDAIGMPVLRTTGEADSKGRLRLTFADLINFYSIVNTLNLPNQKDLEFILSANHQQDLMLDKASTNNYREGIRINPTTGELIGFYTWNIYTNNQNPIYGADGKLKIAGQAAVNTDRDASTFFYSGNTVYHLDDLLILYTPFNTDTKSANPKSIIRLQGHGLVNKTDRYGFGALVSGIKP